MPKKICLLIFLLLIPVAFAVDILPRNEDLQIVNGNDSTWGDGLNYFLIRILSSLNQTFNYDGTIRGDINSSLVGNRQIEANSFKTENATGIFGVNSSIVHDVNTSSFTKVTDQFSLGKNDSTYVKTSDGFNKGNNLTSMLGDGTFNLDVNLIKAKNIYSLNITNVNASNLNMNGSVIPQLNNSFTIGNDTNRYSTIFAMSINLFNKITTTFLDLTDLATYFSKYNKENTTNDMFASMNNNLTAFNNTLKTYPNSSLIPYIGENNATVNQQIGQKINNNTDVTLKNINITGNITTTNIMPDSNGTRNVGNSSMKFANGYYVNITTGDLTFGNGLYISEPDSGTICFYNSSKEPIICMGKKGMNLSGSLSGSCSNSTQAEAVNYNGITNKPADCPANQCYSSFSGTCSACSGGGSATPVSGDQIFTYNTTAGGVEDIFLNYTKVNEIWVNKSNLANNFSDNNRTWKPYANESLLDHINRNVPTKSNFSSETNVTLKPYVTETLDNSTVIRTTSLKTALSNNSDIKLSNVNITGNLYASYNITTNQTVFDNGTLNKSIDLSLYNKSVSLDNYNRSIDLSLYNKSINLVNYNQSISLANYNQSISLINYFTISQNNSIAQITINGTKYYFQLNYNLSGNPTIYLEAFNLSNATFPSSSINCGSNFAQQIFLYSNGTISAICAAASGGSSTPVGGDNIFFYNTTANGIETIFFNYTKENEIRVNTSSLLNNFSDLNRTWKTYTNESLKNYFSETNITDSLFNLSAGNIIQKDQTLNISFANSSFNITPTGNVYVQGTVYSKNITGNANNASYSVGVNCAGVVGAASNLCTIVSGGTDAGAVRNSTGAFPSNATIDSAQLIGYADGYRKLNATNDIFTPINNNLTALNATLKTYPNSSLVNYIIDTNTTSAAFNITKLIGGVYNLTFKFANSFLWLSEGMNISAPSSYSYLMNFNLSFAKFPTSSCPSGQFVTTMSDTGLVTCATPSSSSGASSNSPYLLWKPDSTLPNAIDYRNFTIIDETFDGTQTGRRIVVGTETTNTTATADGTTAILNEGYLGIHCFRTGTASLVNDAGVSLGSSTSTNFPSYNISSLKNFMISFRIERGNLSGVKGAIGLFSTATSQQISTIQNGFFFNFSINQTRGGAANEIASYWSNVMIGGTRTTQNITNKAIPNQVVDGNWTTLEISHDCSGNGASGVVFSMNGINVSNISAQASMPLGFNGSWIGPMIENSSSSKTTTICVDRFVVELCRKSTRGIII